MTPEELKQLYAKEYFSIRLENPDLPEDYNEAFEEYELAFLVAHMGLEHDLECAIDYMDNYELLDENAISNMKDDYANSILDTALDEIPKHLQWYFDEDKYKKDVIYETDESYLLDSSNYGEMQYNSEYIYVREN